jgi:hypothetical protein
MVGLKRLAGASMVFALFAGPAALQAQDAPECQVQTDLTEVPVSAEPVSLVAVYSDELGEEIAARLQEIGLLRGAGAVLGLGFWASASLIGGAAACCFVVVGFGCAAAGCAAAAGGVCCWLLGGRVSCTLGRGSGCAIDDSGTSSFLGGVGVLEDGRG